jgi:HTH-type transcriptional regulator/antitoxin HigA
MPEYDRNGQFLRTSGSGLCLVARGLSGPPTLMPTPLANALYLTSAATIPSGGPNRLRRSGNLYKEAMTHADASAKTQYARLLTGFSPVAIETIAEHGRALNAVAVLMDKENRSPAETSLLKLLAVLVEDYEQKHYSMGDASPIDTLKELMRAREMQAKDLWPVFGSKGITSEVLNGKRGISNEMARKLGEVFSVSSAVFIWVRPMQPKNQGYKTQKQ